MRGVYMKTIEVVAAIIERGDKILATQRGYGEWKGYWEFPGGKMELGETRQEALVREIAEELDTIIEVIEYIETVEYDYPSFHLKMHCFLCRIIAGKMVLKEHDAARWLAKDELESVNWLPADVGLIKKLRERL
jgi:8-oxo-dGTP diphosphatase